MLCTLLHKHAKDSLDDVVVGLRRHSESEEWSRMNKEEGRPRKMVTEGNMLYRKFINANDETWSSFQRRIWCRFSGEGNGVVLIAFLNLIVDMNWTSAMLYAPRFVCRGIPRRKSQGRRARVGEWGKDQWKIKGNRSEEKRPRKTVIERKMNTGSSSTLSIQRRIWLITILGGRGRA